MLNLVYFTWRMGWSQIEFPLEFFRSGGELKKQDVIMSSSFNELKVWKKSCKLTHALNKNREL